MKAKIVLIHFPFTDLTDSKLRPALVLHESEHDVVVALIGQKFRFSQEPPCSLTNSLHLTFTPPTGFLILTNPDSPETGTRFTYETKDQNHVNRIGSSVELPGIYSHPEKPDPVSTGPGCTIRKPRTGPPLLADRERHPDTAGAGGLGSKGYRPFVLGFDSRIS
jgi:hypothetical protein